ncbi:MAG: hypothetical protein ACR2LQ_07755 [Acidimicrobiales bacterium]
MRPRLIAGVLVGLLGVVWVFQGIGVVRGSFMTGHAIWSVFGAVLIVFAVALVRGGRRQP